MRYSLKLSVGLACLCALAASSEALAKSRQRHHHHRYVYAEAEPEYGGYVRRPLILQRRSFLDPGTKVPVGSTNRYVVEQTYFNRNPIEANQRSWYMQETLPQRPPYNVDVIAPYDEGLPF
jgi:hypothetical protein